MVCKLKLRFFILQATSKLNSAQNQVSLRRPSPRNVQMNASYQKGATAIVCEALIGSGCFLDVLYIQIKSLLSHHHSTSALVSEILESVLQTVQKNKTIYIDSTYLQTVQKTMCIIHILNIHCVLYRHT